MKMRSRDLLSPLPDGSRGLARWLLAIMNRNISEAGFSFNFMSIRRKGE